MDSHQTGNKRGIEKISLQKQDDCMPNTSEEGGDEAKRFKQELHPLQMEAVLEQIFSYLDADSIKAARRVNPLWSVEGAKMLMNKCFVKIPWVIRHGEEESKFKAMDKFKAFLSHKSSGISKIPNVTVDAVADVGLWKYLGVLGQQVKSLKICSIGEGDEFFRKLLDLLPNLDHLSFKERNYEPKVIKVLTTVMSTRNFLVIPSLHLSPENMEQVEDLEKFASCNNVIIKALHIKMDPSFLQREQGSAVRVANVLSQLLSTSQNVLKELFLEDCHLIVPLLEIPCLSSLIRIYLSFKPETAGQISSFSPSFRFSEKVPKLQKMEVYVPISTNLSNTGQIVRHCFTTLFESAGTAPTVRSAKCWGIVSDFDVYQLFKTFPNVESFSTDITWHSQAMLHALWKHGKNLKKLRLDLDVYPTKEKIDDLDSSFTGLPVWTVDEIKKAPNLDPFTLEELEEMRVGSSILNLKELRKLTIYFRDGWDKDLPERTLAVAGEHAFKYLPKNPEIIINAEEFYGTMDVDDVSKLPNVRVLKIECSDSDSS